MSRYAKSLPVLQAPTVNRAKAAALIRNEVNEETSRNASARVGPKRQLVSRGVSIVGFRNGLERWIALRR